jgi:hypothetical protein
MFLNYRPDPRGPSRRAPAGLLDDAPPGRRERTTPSSPLRFLLHVYGCGTAIALQTSERHPALVPTC